MANGDLRARVDAQMGEAHANLQEMVAFKSVFVDGTKDECDKAAEYVAKLFGELGFAMQVPTTSDGSKAVFGSKEGPAGSPTVLLYSHYDVQPAPDPGKWVTGDPWKLVERDGRWYGRGAADCKGNLAMHLAALRALGDDLPCSVKLIFEGSEEQGGSGLEHLVKDNPGLLAADAIMIVDSGNRAVGEPTLTTSLRGFTTVDVTLSTLESAVHSGEFGGPAPDPVAALVSMLATLHGARGDTTVDGLPNDGRWEGEPWEEADFRRDATLRDGVDVVGSGPIADMAWARPSATIIGIDGVPSVKESSPAIQPEVTARVSLRVPNGVRAADAQELLVEHLRRRVPWNAKATFAKGGAGDPFAGVDSGRAFSALSDALAEAYGKQTVTQGQGGSIPLCNVLQQTYPEAEIMIYGVEEPLCRIHAPNESVDPGEIAHIALAEALFLQRFGS